MKGDFKRIARLFTNTVAYFRLGLRNLRLRRKLLSKWRKYVPKYPGRSWEEHEIIRRMIRVPEAGCSHLKGGRRRATSFKDFNVSMHTFIGGNKRVICNTCRKKWTPESPDWNEALKMVEQSSNRESSTEQPLKCNMDGPLPEDVLNATFDNPVLYKGRYVYSRD